MAARESTAGYTSLWSAGSVPPCADAESARHRVLLSLTSLNHEVQIQRKEGSEEPITEWLRYGRFVDPFLGLSTFDHRADQSVQDADVLPHHVEAIRCPDRPMTGYHQSGRKLSDIFQNALQIAGVTRTHPGVVVDEE